MNPPEGPSSPPPDPAPKFVYILRCADSSYYVGHAEDLEARIHLHNSERAAAWTSVRRPVTLVYTEPFGNRLDAIRRERQLKGWSRAKKDALVEGNLTGLKLLSASRSQHPPALQVDRPRLTRGPTTV